MIRRDATQTETVSANGDVEAVGPPVVAESPTSPPERRPTTGPAVAQLLIACGVVAASLFVAYLLVASKTAPARLPPVQAAPVVRVAEVSVADVATTVEGFGRLRAATQLDVVPQVGGRVIRVHPQLRAGGSLAAGEVVIEIERTDYELESEQRQADLQRAEASQTRVEARRRVAEAEVARARATLDTSRAEAFVSREEFARLNPDVPVPPLVAREPQLRSDEASLAAAEAGLAEVEAEELEFAAATRQAASLVRQAEVALGRTFVTLPEGASSFRVVSQAVDVGQSVAAGQVLATAFDPATLEVAVPLADAELAFVQVPGGVARVTSAGTEAPGVADRTGGTIAAGTQLVEVIVRLSGVVEDAAFVPGRFVTVTLEGLTAAGVTALPREAVRADGQGTGRHVQVVRDGTIAFVPVTVIRTAGDEVLVRGVAPGERVVLTRLDVATQGMRVQVLGDVVEGGEASR